MDFGQAIEELKQGKKVKREHWEGYWVLSERVFVEDVREWVDHDVIIAWVPSLDKHCIAQPYQIDLLAEDWEVVE